VQIGKLNLNIGVNLVKGKHDTAAGITDFGRGNRRTANEAERPHARIGSLARVARSYAETGKRCADSGAEIIMGETSAYYSEKSKVLAWGLQTVGGVLLAAIAWFVKDAHSSIEKMDNRIQQSEGRHIRTETRLDGQENLLKEIRDDVKRILETREKKP